MGTSGIDEKLSGEATPAGAGHRILQGQKALVTGASSGIGKAVAVALGRAGADVAVNYVKSEAEADEVNGISLFVDGGMTLYPGFAEGG